MRGAGVHRTAVDLVIGDELPEAVAGKLALVLDVTLALFHLVSFVGIPRISSVALASEESYMPRAVLLERQ